MAYTLNYSGGTITVTDGTLNTASTSLALPGRNYAGYGQPVDQNMVYLTENFAYFSGGPSNPLKGQVWYDTVNTVLKYNSGSPSSPVWTSLATIGADATFGNITITGSVLGNLSVTGHHIFSTATGISAAGTIQSDATLLNKDFNVVVTVPSNSGVRLPVTTGGLRITVINSSGNNLNVYPNVGAQINSPSTINAPYVLAGGSRLEFLSTSGSQWYTLNATYS